MKREKPILTSKERDRRWKLVRDMMKTKGLDCLIVAGLNGREKFESYLSNDYTQGIVIFPIEGDPIYLTWASSRITRHMENCLRGIQPWIKDWRVGVSGPVIVELLKEKGFDSSYIGVVGIETSGPGEPEGFIPYKTWSYILERLPKVTFIDVSQSFAEIVFIKSEEEIALVRYSAWIGEMACQAMLEITKPGVSESEICGEIMKVIISNGASPQSPALILHSGVDNTSWGPPIWFYQAQQPRILQEGDVVQAEIFPWYGGIETQQQMCIAIKPIHPINQKLSEIARNVYEIGLKFLRPGKKFKDVVEAMELPITEAGCWHLTPLIHSLSPLMWVGYSNVRIEQLPGISNYKATNPVPIIGGDLIIKPGMVFELEPNACQGKYRINIGGTVLVTETGVEELNNLPTKMQIRE